MKKSLSTLLLTVFSTSLFVGCGQTLTTQSPQLQQFRQASTQRRVATFKQGQRSDQGLKVASERLRELAFTAMDFNGDGTIEIQEFYPGIQHFVKVDINRDGHISRDEAVNGAEFGNAINSNPDHLRSSGKLSFDFLNKNQDQFITKDELLAVAEAPTSPPPSLEPPPAKKNSFVPQFNGDLYQLKVELTKAFNFNDRDYNQKLDFSEFEDLVAFSIVSQNEIPYPMPTSTPSSASRK